LNINTGLYLGFEIEREGREGGFAFNRKQIICFWGYLLFFYDYPIALGLFQIKGNK